VKVLREVMEGVSISSSSEDETGIEERSEAFLAQKYPLLGFMGAKRPSEHQREDNSSWAMSFLTSF
jgi:hypothetical protein